MYLNKYKLKPFERCLKRFHDLDINTWQAQLYFTYLSLLRLAHGLT